MAKPTQRQPTRIRQVERCSGCGERAIGITTIELRPWDKQRPEHIFHFCDPCSEAIVVRPLEDVLLDYLE